MTKIVLATCTQMPEPDPDERLLVEALRRRGRDVHVRSWDDANADFRSSLCVVRSTWNYHLRCEEFLGWSRRVPNLVNSKDVIAWNAKKTYLRELSDRGIAITDTVWLDRGETADVRAILDERGWDAFVVKPTISAGSFATVRGTRNDLVLAQRHLDEQLAVRDMMVQRYVASVEDYGERALVYIDSAITHSVRKTPRFAGQSEQVSKAIAVAEDEEKFAREVLARVPGDDLLYARIDVARDDRGGLLVMELELIEPSLFLLQSPVALERFVDAIVRRADLNAERTLAS